MKLEMSVDRQQIHTLYGGQFISDAWFQLARNEKNTILVSLYKSCMDGKYEIVSVEALIYSFPRFECKYKWAWFNWYLFASIDWAIYKKGVYQFPCAILLSLL